MKHIARFRAFTQAMTRLVSDTTNENTLLQLGEGLLRQLIAADDWLPCACARSSAETYRQYLLHCDPLERFCITAFVWEPGQHTPVHDHLTWGLIGQLRGEELCEEYIADEADRLTRCGSHRMRPGDVDRVSPKIGDIHAVSNASSAISVSIHVYGANIGAHCRHVFDAATGVARTFVSDYHNDSVPNLWKPTDA